MKTAKTAADIFASIPGRVAVKHPVSAALDQQQSAKLVHGNPGFKPEFKTRALGLKFANGKAFL